MTFDPVSFALGVAAAYVFSCVLCIAICVVELRTERKQRVEAVDQQERERALEKLLAGVAIRCMEIPTDSRVN